VLSIAPERLLEATPPNFAIIGEHHAPQEPHSRSAITPAVALDDLPWQSALTGLQRGASPSFTDDLVDSATHAACGGSPISATDDDHSQMRLAAARTRLYIAIVRRSNSSAGMIVRGTSNERTESK
jgi:hypothetical protein